MRKLFILMSVLLLALPSMAQEKNKKGVEKPYATNTGFFDNTYIGIGGGVNIMTGDCDVSHDYDAFPSGKATHNNLTHNVTPSIDVFFGKWWTPVVGMRLAYHGYSAFGFTTDTNGPFVSQDWDLSCGHVREKMNYNSGRIDVTLNLCNAIGGYRENRFWDVIPYIGFGAADINGKNVRTDVRTDVWSFFGDFGILNHLRLCRRLAINLDVRYLMSDNRFDLATEDSGHKVDGLFTASAGLSVKLGTVGFRHSEKADYSRYDDQIAAYKKELDDINALLAARMSDLDGLKGQLASSDSLNAELRKSASKIKSSRMVVYFAIDSAELDKKELALLDTYLKGLNGRYTLSIEATADSRTGSANYNRKLSEKRAKYLSSLIEKQYGAVISEQAGTGESETHTNAKLNRAGIIIVNFE